MSAIEERIPLVEERLAVEKRRVVTGRVRVHTHVDEQKTWVREDLEREEVEVVRVPIDQEVETPPAVRVEDGVVVVPVVEEVLVVERRLVLKEEIHLRRRTVVDHIEQPVVLRRTRADIERVEIGDAEGR